MANSSVNPEQAGAQPVPPPQPPQPDFLQNALGVLRGFGQNVANRNILPFPSLINPTFGDVSPVSFDAAPNKNFYDQTVYGPGTYERPVSGGIARIMTSPLAQKIQPDRTQIDNPLFALGPAGDFAGPFEPALAAGKAQLGQLARGAGELLHGNLPAFAQDTAGMAKYDLGVLGGGDIVGGLSGRIGARGNLGRGEAFSDAATSASQGAVDSQKQMVIDRQVQALEEKGATPQQIADFRKTMAPTAEKAPRGELITATGATVNAGKMTRAIQTALGAAEGGGMPETLTAFAPGGAKFAAEGRRHGGVIGAATRAVMANDPAVTEALGPELSQQLAQGKIAQLARSSGADESVIRQALQIMDSAAKTVAPEAKSLVADAVASRAPALSPEAEATVFAAEHAALTSSGLAATDEAMQAMRDRLIAQAREAVLTASKSAQTTAGFVEALRKSGEDDTKIVDALRAMGIKAEDAISAVRGTAPDLRYPGAVTGVPDMAAIRASRRQPPTEVSQPVADTLFDPLRGMAPNPNLPPSGPPTLPPAPPSNPQAPLPFQAAKLFADTIGGAFNVAKQLSATLDISQVMRQGLIPVVSAALSRDPQLRVVARDAFVNAIKGYSDRYAGQVWSEVMADPLYTKWKAAGATERTIPAESLSHLQTAAQRSELFTGPLAGVGPVRAADRSFSLTLNAVNFYRWKQSYEAIRAGRGIVTDAEQKALATWFDVTTGQGKLPPGVASALNGIFWAPRFVVARAQTPYYAMKFLADPKTREVGKIAATDMGKTIVAGLGFLEAAQLAGFKVGWDWTSTDFGKVQVGDTNIDIWGGFQQPTVLLARMILDQYTSGSGAQSSLSQGGFNQTNTSDLIWRYIQSKFGPGPGTILALASGKDFNGQPFGPRGGQAPLDTVGAMASGRLAPMSWADVITAVQDDLKNGTSTARGLPGGSLGAVAGASSLLGLGANTYARTKAYDGLGRDLNGPIPDDPVLDAWKTVRENSAKNAKGTLTFSDLTAPDDTIGAGTSQIVVTPEEHGRLAKLVGDARKAIIGAAIADPKWAASGQGDKEKTLAEAKAKADNLGRTQFGIELAQQATDDTARVRATNIALNAASGDTGKTMDVLAMLNAQGSLTPAAKAAVDGQRQVQNPLDKGYELSVDEYLRGSQLVQRFVAAPARNIGDQQTWLAAAHEAALLKAAYDALNREATSRGVQVYSLAGYKTLLSQYRTTKVGGYPIARFSDVDGTVNDASISPQRAALSQDPLWSHFRAIAEKRDPYTPH